MPRECVLGIDVGTSSTKGVLVTLDGEVVAAAAREHTVSRPRPGHVEMSPSTWWDEFRSIAAELTDRDGTTVVAVGVSGMGPCVVLLDDRGEPVRDAILYGVDTRARAQIARIERALGADAVVRRGGSALSTQAAGPKIAWVAEHEPEQYARARRLTMPASFIGLRLTGRYGLDHHSASQCSPLYDLGAHDWARDWAPLVAPGIDLPPLLQAGDVLGETTPAGVAGTGLPAGVPVVMGTIDAWAEGASVGALEVGDLMLMYGTTMFLIATTAEPVRSRALWTTAGVAEGAWSLAGGMATSGAITTWLRDLTGGSDYAALSAEADRAGVGAGGLLMLPYFAGERTPVPDPDARGVVAGLTLSHERGHLYRAALEATAFGVRHNIEAMREAGARIERVVAVGGGTSGGLWTRIVSDVTGLPQHVAANSIGASFGVAHLAASALARREGRSAPAIGDWNPVVEVVEPDPAATARYDRLWPLYRGLHAGTLDVVHALADLQSTP